MLVPIDAQGFTLARIASVVGHVAFAGDEIHPAVAVEIYKCGCVRLRPRVIDDVPHPLAIQALLQPKDSVIVRAGG